MDPVIEAGLSVASEAAPSLLAKIKKHIGYLINYKDNLKNLEVAKNLLDAKRSDARRFFSEASSQLKDVSSTTTLWRTQADDLYDKAHDIISQNKVSCLKLCSRYSMSRHAWELTQEIKQKAETAPDFGTKFDRPSQDLGATFNLKGFMEFESRIRVLNEVLEAIKDEEVSMCSICGMGGTGKTTLAKKLVQRVEVDHLFDKVAMVTVSQVPNMDKIQKEIIEQLGIKMDEETTKARSKKLNAWLAENNTLLILDDVWWQLSDDDFDLVGIPLVSKKCKIILISRNEDECMKTGSQRNFLISVLEHKEAWDLFRLNAGKCVEDLNMKEVARKIADECDGLPIAIVTIAAALKDKPLGVWNDSLRNLQNSNLQRISGMEKVYSRIQLSYDLLKDKEAQSCFLLCCLFPEDYDVSIEELVFCGKGLEIFTNVHSIDDARDRVEAIIHKLKKSFLLLDGEEEGSFRLHDIMRDFAISISSDSFLIKHGKEMTEWPNTLQYADCRAISFIFDKIMLENHIDIRCPKLELLFLSKVDGPAGLPLGIFEGMKKLKVLFLSVHSLKLVQPLVVLKELRTLILCESHVPEIELPKIGDLLGHRELKNLEIFALISYVHWNDFPVEIGLLCNLRLLDLRNMRFDYMPPGVLSKLTKLEELPLLTEFKDWGCKEENGERINASLDEIELLPLTKLCIGIKEGSSLGEKLVKNLKRFKLIMGGGHLDEDEFDGEKFHTTLSVSEVDASVLATNWMIALLTKSEILMLSDINNFMFLHPTPLQWKKIEIRSCEEIVSFINTAVQTTCFSNLSDINILECSQLKFLFPLSVARELTQLQTVGIRYCDNLKEIFSRNYGNQIAEENLQRDNVDAIAAEVVLPNLKEMHLEGNAYLEVMYGGNDPIELPSFETLIIDECFTMKAFSYGSLISPKLNLVLLNGINYSYMAGDDLNAFLKKWRMEEKKTDDEDDW